MVEWSITAVLKTAVLKGTGGSNPSLSAKKQLTRLLFLRYKRGMRSTYEIGTRLTT